MPEHIFAYVTFYFHFFFYFWSKWTTNIAFSVTDSSSYQFQCLYLRGGSKCFIFLLTLHLAYSFDILSLSTVSQLFQVVMFASCFSLHMTFMDENSFAFLVASNKNDNGMLPLACLS